MRKRGAELASSHRKKVEPLPLWTTRACAQARQRPGAGDEVNLR